MSKKVFISKKIAAGLMAGLMLGSFVPVRAGLWGSMKRLGNDIKTNISATVSSIQQIGNQSADTMNYYGDRLLDKTATVGVNVVDRTRRFYWANRLISSTVIAAGSALAAYMLWSTGGYNYLSQQILLGSVFKSSVGVIRFLSRDIANAHNFRNILYVGGILSAISFMEKVGIRMKRLFNADINDNNNNEIGIETAAAGHGESNTITSKSHTA